MRAVITHLVATSAFCDAQGQVVVKEIGRLGDIRATLDLAATVCMALRGLHRRGYIHRDIKPANILLRKLDQPILSDLGLVFLEGDGDDERWTTLGDRLITAGYSPPEAGPAAPGSPAWDVYMLGKTINWLLIGPRGAPKIGEAMSATEYFADASYAAVDALVGEMCQPNLSKRIRSIDVVVSRIGEILSSRKVAPIAAG